jgi:hypothetical protein
MLCDLRPITLGLLEAQPLSAVSYAVPLGLPVSMVLADHHLSEVCTDAPAAQNILVGIAGPSSVREVCVCAVLRTHQPLDGMFCHIPAVTVFCCHLMP